MAVLLFLTLLICAAFSRKPVLSEEQRDILLNLKELHELGVLDRSEYVQRRNQILDEYTGPARPTEGYQHYRKVVGGAAATNTSNWTMPVVFTPQVDWLLSIFDGNMPRSYDDVSPYGGKSYWRSHVYLSEGARDYNGTRLDFDSQVAIQERALTHVGLNIYDGGVWGIALAVSGLAGITDIYHRNVLYTSSTGANPKTDGLKSIRAWEPNPAKDHPPDPFKYGKEGILNTALKPVTMPFNFSFILFDQGKCQTCETSGCCPQTGKKQIPGNYFYRMIGPGYLMRDPLMGYYGYEWRAKPFGTNTDPAQWWNFAGVIHWNDWKPITGENVWAAILAPMQVLFIKNCSHIEKFKDFDSAPPEVQLALSIMPATEALLSPMGSMYHCPNGTKMFPPDEAEETNVSNENNFSAWAAYKAFLFILKNFYQGSDEVIDGAVDLLSKKLIPGLENWFQNHLLPAKIAGENVVSQGGHVTFDGKYEYQKGAQSFAVDCQTWGMLVLGSKRFDTWYKGTQTAYGIWKAVKKLAGYYINDEIAGVGYTTPEKNTTSKTLIWSGEWTWGAVYMCRRLAKEYETSNAAWSAELKKDAESMIKYMKKEVVPCDDGVWCDGGLVQSDGSYLYANKRFFIPWGWYANPVGATSSTGWAVLNDFLYDPFTLGGGNSTTFWKDQCANNTATPGILQKLSEWYEFKG